MIKIRNGCFETNSSSSHAMIMLKDDKPLPQMIESGFHVYKGKLEIWYRDLEFGRSPFDVLANWYHRMCYAIASFNNDSSYEDIVAILYKRIGGLREVEIFGGDRDEYYKYGYVDHQSQGMLQRFLRQHDISIEEFIFNDRYIVIIDGDEYQVWDRLVGCGLINEDKVELCEE